MGLYFYKRFEVGDANQIRKMPSDFIDRVVAFSFANSGELYQEQLKSLLIELSQQTDRTEAATNLQVNEADGLDVPDNSSDFPTANISDAINSSKSAQRETAAQS